MRKPKLKLPHVKTKVADLIDLSDQEHIKNGMAILDQEVGKGWPLLINLDTFDIGNGSRCVLGQVFARSVEAAKEAGETDPYGQAIENGYGFRDLVRQDIERTFDLNGFAQDALFKYLWDEPFAGSIDNDKWQKAIEARQLKLCGGDPAHVRYVQRKLKVV